MCDRIGESSGGTGVPPELTRATIELQVGSPEAALAYRSMLGDLRGIAVSDRPLLEGSLEAATEPARERAVDARIEVAEAVGRCDRRIRDATLQERSVRDGDAPQVAEHGSVGARRFG